MKNILAVVSAMIVFSGCLNNRTGPGSSNVLLTAEYVGVTEASFRLQIIPAVPHNVVRLTRNGTTILTTGYRGLDTLLTDQYLLPRQSYIYRAYALNDSIPRDTSNTLTISTMDTTSHNFTFEIDTLGDGASSYLNDVAIINDTLAYAVGAMYKLDSTGQFDPSAYNLAKWNGKQWQLMRIPFYGICGQSHLIYYPARAIFALSDTDVWIGMDGDQVTRWNGSIATSITCLPVLGPLKKLWGQSPNSMYAVGDGGTIDFYDGHAWQQLESGTTLDIQDIWGSRDHLTEEWEILAVAGNYYNGPDRKILRISGTTVAALSDSGIGGALNGLWYSSGKHYWVVGEGIWDKHFTLQENGWGNGSNNITNYVTNRIRGGDVNDIFFVGAFGDCFHFNGMSWHSFRSQTNLSNGEYVSIAVTGNIIFAVGLNSPLAVVTRGRRH